MLRTLLVDGDAKDPVLQRLYPNAFTDDDEASTEFREIVHDDQLEGALGLGIAGEVRGCGLLGDGEPHPEDQPDVVQRGEPRDQLVLGHMIRSQGPLHRVDSREPLFELVVVHDLAELRRRLVVVGEGVRVQPLQHRVLGVTVHEQRAQHVRKRREDVALARRDPQVEPAPARPLDGGSGHAQRSFCNVAHSPWACRRDTSNSQRSRGPEETTARPFWCTSSISLVALSRG